LQRARETSFALKNLGNAHLALLSRSGYTSGPLKQRVFWNPQLLIRKARRGNTSEAGTIRSRRVKAQAGVLRKSGFQKRWVVFGKK